MIRIYGYFDADKLALVNALHLKGIGIIVDLFVLLSKLASQL